LCQVKRCRLTASIYCTFGLFLLAFWSVGCGATVMSHVKN